MPGISATTDARRAIAAIGQEADLLDTTPLHVDYGNGGFGGGGLGSSPCDAARCITGTDEFEIIFTPENLSAIPRNADLQSRGAKRGVSLVEYSGTSATALEFSSLNRPTSVDYHTLGGWMEYSVFTVNLWQFDPTDWQIWNAASFGVESGSNPVSGSAIWTGAMVGRTRGPDHQPGVLVMGESRLTFDFATNELDAALTAIQSGNGQAYADLAWENMPTTNGRFAGTTYSPIGAIEGSISGRFYGPNHEEVGGLIDHAEFLGAFGASRQ
ncbi:MAG: transferrin-binding protein-like solute binding protein [Nitrospira sp.]|nr:transferrin-binding protein-like solute binding protein [Nitrospira sp.]